MPQPTAPLRPFLAALLISSPLLAKEEGWSGSSNVGVTIATGNSESLRATAGLEGTGRFGEWEALGKAGAIYGDDDGVRANEQLAALLQLNRDLSERIYAGLNTEFLYDAVADVDYRFGISPLLGIRILDDERMTLRFEAGPGYVWESRNGVADSYLSLRAHEAFTYQVSDDTRFFQSLTAVFEAADLGNVVVTAEAGVESKVIGQWSLRLAARAVHYGETRPGMESSDLLVTAGLGYNFMPADHDVEALEEAAGELKAKDDEWVVTALLGGSLAQGNTDSLSISAGLEARRTRSEDELAAGVFGSYGETENLMSTQAISADAHYQRNFAGPWFAGLRADVDHDAVADLDWRVALSPYVGRRLIATSTTKLSVEAGPSLVAEQQGGSEQTYLAAYAGLKGEQKIGPATRIFVDVAWLAELAEFSSYLLTSEAGVDHALSERISLKLIARSNYDSTPAPGRQRHDLQFVSALGLDF